MSIRPVAWAGGCWDTLFLCLVSEWGPRCRAVTPAFPRDPWPVPSCERSTGLGALSLQMCVLEFPALVEKSSQHLASLPGESWGWCHLHSLPLPGMGEPGVGIGWSWEGCVWCWLSQHFKGGINRKTQPKACTQHSVSSTMFILLCQYFLNSTWYFSLLGHEKDWVFLTNWNSVFNLLFD